MRIISYDFHFAILRGQCEIFVRVIILETFKSLKFPENLSLEQTTTNILMLLSFVTFISTL